MVYVVFNVNLGKFYKQLKNLIDVVASIIAWILFSVHTFKGLLKWFYLGYLELVVVIKLFNLKQRFESTKCNWTMKLDESVK